MHGLGFRDFQWVLTNFSDIFDFLFVFIKVASLTNRTPYQMQKSRGQSDQLFKS